MDRHSGSKDIEQYSFLHALANDDIIDEAELDFMIRLAMADGLIDEEEKKTLCRILDRVNLEHLDTTLKEKLKAFQHQLQC